MLLSSNKPTLSVECNSFMVSETVGEGCVATIVASLPQEVRVESGIPEVHFQQKTDMSILCYTKHGTRNVYCTRV